MNFTLCPLFFSSGSIRSRIRNFPDACTNCSSICINEIIIALVLLPIPSYQIRSFQLMHSCVKYLKFSSGGVQRILYQVSMVAAPLQQHKYVLQFQVDLSINWHKNIHHWAGAKERVIMSHQKAHR